MAFYIEALSCFVINKLISIFIKNTTTMATIIIITRTNIACSGPKWFVGWGLRSGARLARLHNSQAGRHHHQCQRLAGALFKSTSILEDIFSSPKISRLGQPEVAASIFRAAGNFITLDIERSFSKKTERQQFMFLIIVSKHLNCSLGPMSAMLLDQKGPYWTHVTDIFG